MTDDPLPRLMSRAEAAKHLGISPSMFSAWVTAGYMPKPVFRSKRWDRLAIDDAFDRLRGIEPSAKSANEKPMTPYQKWKAEADLDPSPPQPSISLVERQERALRALGKKYPDHLTSAEIDGVGDMTLQELVGKGVARCNGKDKRGRLIFVLTKSGYADFLRLSALDEWRAGNVRDIRPCSRPVVAQV